MILLNSFFLFELVQYTSYYVIFIPLYTVAGFSIFPPTMLPSHFHLQLSYFQNFSSIMHFPFSYIIYSTFFIVLAVFSVLLFQCPFFQLPPSNQFPAVFPVHRPSHFLNLWPVISLVFFVRCHFPSFPLFLTVSLHFPNSVPLISLMSYIPTFKFQI